MENFKGKERVDNGKDGYEKIPSSKRRHVEVENRTRRCVRIEQAKRYAYLLVLCKLSTDGIVHCSHYRFSNIETEIDFQRENDPKLQDRRSSGPSGWHEFHPKKAVLRNGRPASLKQIYGRGTQYAS